MKEGAGRLLQQNRHLTVSVQAARLHAGNIGISADILADVLALGERVFEGGRRLDASVADREYADERLDYLDYSVAIPRG